jgi:hypothetical protein
MVVIGGVVWVQHIASKTLTDAIAEADRVDPGWRIEDIERNREVVPPVDNSAILMADVHALLPDDWKRAEMRGSGIGGGPVPMRGMMLFSALPLESPNVLLSTGLADAVRDECKRLSEAIAKSRKLVHHPKGRYDVVFPTDYIGMRLDHVQDARTIARLIDFDALARVQEGDADGALESCRALLNAGRSIGDEPLLLSQIVRISITTMTCSAVERTLARGEPGDEALAAMQNALAAEAEVPYAETGLRGERGLVFRMIGSMGRNDLPAESLALPRFGPARPVVCQYNQGLSLHLLTDAVAIARKPDHLQPPLWRGWQSRLSTKNRSRVELIGGMLAYLLVPAMEGIAPISTRARCLVGATAVLAAAERFRKAENRWPESIQELETTLQTKLPLDPYTGAPFLLKRTSDGLTVYSVGPDGTDNGGALSNHPTKPNGDYGFRLWDLARRRQAP